MTGRRAERKTMSTPPWILFLNPKHVELSTFSGMMDLTPETPPGGARSSRRDGFVA